MRRVIVPKVRERRGEANSRCESRSVGVAADVAELIAAVPRKHDLVSAVVHGLRMDSSAVRCCG